MVTKCNCAPLSLAGPAAAPQQTLIFSYGTHNAPPYVQHAGGNPQAPLNGGLLYHIGEELALRLGVRARYVEVPPKRLEEWLINGTVHAYCEWNPIWVAQAHAMLWAGPLYQSSDRYLVHQDRDQELNHFGALKGLTVGTLRGFHYSRDFMNMDLQKRLIRVEVGSPEQLLQMLSLKRVDAVILDDLIARYLLNLEAQPGQLRFTALVDDRKERYCAYSPLAPISFQRFSQAVRDMREDGTMATILQDGVQGKGSPH